MQERFAAQRLLCLPWTAGFLLDSTPSRGHYHLQRGWDMQRWAFGLAATWWLAAGISAQEKEPGALATSTEKLDYLLSTWRGQPVARVRKVFGHEDATEMRGSNPVLVYEKRVKIRAAVGGFTVHPNGGARCVVRFLISETEEVLRVARQGGGDECWEAWRDYKP